MIVRAYRPTDAPRLANILHTAVHAVGARDYTTAQLEAWSPAPILSERFHERVSDGRSVWVAVSKDDVPLAFIELEPDGHIDCFYRHPDVAGKGIGKALFDRLKTAAITAGIRRLHVEASEAARRFFLREGFRCLERHEFELRGVHIHNYEMELRLSSAGNVRM